MYVHRTTFLSLSTFQVEVEEALDKVITTLKLFGSFKASFREFRGKLPTYFGEGKKPKTWEFQVKTFGRVVQELFTLILRSCKTSKLFISSNFVFVFSFTFYIGFFLLLTLIPFLFSFVKLGRCKKKIK